MMTGKTKTEEPVEVGDTNISQPDEGVDANASQPKMVKIILNNREVEVPESTVDSLQQTEHDLKSGYDKMLAEERVTMKSGEDEHNRLFTEDRAWYQSHEQSEWDDYSPKCDGGVGYTGNGNNSISQQKEIQSVTTSKPDTSNAFGLKQEVEILKVQNKKIQDDLSSIRKDNNTRIE